jgi:hypothetical protein
MAVRAPVEFVVCRHLLSHPEESPAAIAKHCNLLLPSAARSYHRIQAMTQLQREPLFRHMLSLSERPPRREIYFQMPNPELWANRFKGQKWLSGEAAAARDGYPLVPQRLLYYVPADQIQKAAEDAIASYGKLSGGKEWNLALRAADPWLSEDEDTGLVEYGQRRLDYWESPHVQLARDLRDG